MRTSIYERVAALSIVAAAAGLPIVVSCGSSSSGSPDASTSHDASSNGDATSGNHDAPSAETSTGDSATDAGIDSTLATDSGADVEVGADADATTADADSGPETGLTEGGATVASYLGTQPPGDVWTWTLDHGAGTFSAQDVTNGYTYSGTLSQVTGTGIVGNGFTRLSIASTTDPAASSWTKHEAFAVELPGVALLVSPPGPPASINAGTSNGYYSSLIVASAVGTCPATGGTFNTIVIPRTSWASQGSLLTPGESVTGPGYGTATLALSGGSFTISGSTTAVTLTYTDAGDWTITDAGVTSIPSAMFGCDGGYLTSATAGTPTIGVTPAGVLIEDMGGADPNISGLIGVAQTAIAGLGSLQGEYLGFIFVNEAAVPPNPATPYTIAVSCTPGSSADAGNEICQPYDSLDPVTPSTFGISDAAVQIPVFFDTTSTTTGVISNHTTNFNGNPGLFSQNVSMVTQIGGKAVMVGITGSGSVPSLQNMMIIQQ
jgi:hypothetical protein